MLKDFALKQIMKIYDPANLKYKYKDRLAEKRHKVFIFKLLFFTGLFIAGTGLVFYLLFFSGLLDIKDVTLSGLDKIDNNKFNEKLNERLNSKWLGLIEEQKNIVFFDSDSFKAEITSGFPEIKEISVGKKIPHSLSVNVVERKTAGIWCFVESCKYFDEEGQTWGEAVRSSGFLILVVDDLRQGGQLDKDLLKNFLSISRQLKEMNILVNKYTIPDDFFGDFKVFTSKGFELLFSADSNIEEQLEVFKIFLANKEKDSPPAGGFHPKYIDLRIPGRVYYK